MGKKRRHPRRERPVCLKVGYEMQADAEAFARKTASMWGRKRAYLCRECGLWHLTSQ